MAKAKVCEPCYFCEAKNVPHVHMHRTSTAYLLDVVVCLTCVDEMYDRAVALLLVQRLDGGLPSPIHPN